MTERSTLERINKMLDMIETHAIALIEAADPRAMEPKDASIAASKHALVMAKLLDLKHSIEGTEPSDGEDALINAILGISRPHDERGIL